MIKFAIGIPVIVAISSFVLNAILAMLLALTYSTLTKESIVATIKFEKVVNQDKAYVGLLFSDTGEKIGDYEIYGDQWRMDAAFIKMEYWANVFGLDSKYTLNRFEGRYKDIKDENSKKHKAYQLESHAIIDKFSFLVDTTYGSSVYQDIKLNTLYTVLKSQTGLLVREKLINATKEEGYMDKVQSFLGFN